MVLYAYSLGASRTFLRRLASVPGLAFAIKALRPTLSFFNFHTYIVRSDDDPRNARLRSYRRLCT